MTTSTIKRTLLALTIIAIPLSCIREAESQPQEEAQEKLHEVVFHAGWEPETKTALQEDGSVWWSPGDEISLLVRRKGTLCPENGGYKLKSTNMEPAAKADFVGQIADNLQGATQITAIYPYSESNRIDNWGNVYFTIPSEQVAKEGTFDNGLFVSVATADGENLMFRNLCGGIKFSVAHEGIKKVEFYSNQSLQTGKLRLNNGVVTKDSSYPIEEDKIVVSAPNGYFEVGKFYYAVAAARESGFNERIRVTYYKDDSSATTFLPETTFKRAVFKRLYEADKDLKFIRTYDSMALLNQYFLPESIDKTAITEAHFHVLDPTVTDTIISSEDGDYEPIYFEMIGTVAHFYTNAQVYKCSQINFSGWESLRSLDLSMFDVSDNSAMSHAFEDCKSLESLDLSSFDTSEVLYFGDMFKNCVNLKELDVTNFDTSKAISMSGMFRDCHNLKELDLSMFDVSHVTDMQYLFYYCTSLKHLNISSWNTSSCTSFDKMFAWCISLKRLDVSSWDTSACTNMTDMFYHCDSLEAIDVSNFDTSRAENLSYMFAECKNLRSIDVSGFDTRNVTRIEGMFGGCASLSEIDLSSFDFRSVIGLDGLFGRCSSLVHFEADFSTVDPNKLFSIRQMFEGCKKLESIDLTGLRTDNVIWMNAMFRQCVSLKSVDLSGFNTANVQLMDMMFESCCSLTSIDLSSFDTGSVTDMSFMFDGCSRLKDIDLSFFDTRNVTNMSCMFRNCMSLANLDIRGFNAASLTNATELFCFDFKLASLNLGSFDLSGVDITTSGSLTGRNSKRCNVKCIAATKNALINKSGGFTSEIFIWYGENDEMPAYQQEERDPNLYYSSDYSKDGTTKTVQTASSGAGVDIVLMGDAYSDRMIADGTYDNDMQKVIDAIFTFEPYKSLKELFNVYIVYVVSENEVIGKSTALATYDIRSGYGAIGSEDSWRIEVYTRKATSKIDFREVTPIVVLNSTNLDGAVWTTLHHAQDDYLNDPNWDDYHGGESVAYVSGPNTAFFEEYIVRHECGHALGQLADEYIMYDQEIDSYSKQQFQWGMNYGQWKNIDFTNDVESVKWKSFISDNRYSNSRIGMYEGAKYAIGVWRPTENSIMREDYFGQYNAPSREAIYYRLNKIAYGNSWQYDYETFVQQDLKNIPQSAPAPAKRAPSLDRVNRKPYLKIEESIKSNGKKGITVIMN